MVRAEDIGFRLATHSGADEVAVLQGVAEDAETDVVCCAREEDEVRRGRHCCISNGVSIATAMSGPET